MEHDRGLDLPKVMEPLAPFIKPRQEAAQTRRILSIFLDQNIHNPHGESDLPIVLASPPEGTQVGLIAPQLTGIRRSYLKALQAYIRARESYDQLSTRLEEDRIKAKRREQRETESCDHVSAITLYDLLHEQRRYQKLIILRDVLEQLAHKETAEPDYLDSGSLIKSLTLPPEVPTTFSTPLLSLVEDETEALVSNLEKAVLRARGAFENEKSLLVKAKEKYDSQAIVEGAHARISALHRTRDELINWLELRLASTDDDSLEEPRPLTPESVTLDIDQRIKHIQEKYHCYLDARKSLLAFMSERRDFVQKTPPITQEELAPPPLLPPKKEIVERKHEANKVLPYLTEYLIPQANQQRTSLQCESHLVRSLINENQATIQALEVLADESHLLSRYPIPAPDPSFQKELASPSSMSLYLKGSAESRQHRVIAQAESWAFAAEAARSSQESTIEEPLNHGEKEVDVAKNILQELRDMLGLQNDDDGLENQDPRIPVDKSDQNSRKFNLPRGSQSSKGVWAGLDGKLGINQ